VSGGDAGAALEAGHASVTPDGSNAGRVSSSAVQPRATANPVHGGGRPSTGFCFGPDQSPSPRCSRSVVLPLSGSQRRLQHGRTGGEQLGPFRIPSVIRKRLWAQRGKRYQQLGARPASRTTIGKRMGSTTRKDVCYVAFFAFFGVFAFFVFARCGAVGVAALVLVSPGATAPPGAGAVTWPGVPARAGPPEL